MKGFFLLSSLLVWCAFSAVASPGDTIIVQSHTETQLSYYGDYDSPVNFADTVTTYRNITMTFTLGKYNCPGNPQYCGDWDYTVQVFLVTPNETFELGRFMTPYAGISTFPFSWKHRYNFDVTDYAQYLKGENTIRILYMGYSGGFTANVKFTAIEGTPPRNVLKIDRLWAGTFDYGRQISIENQVYAKSLQMPAGAESAVLKMNVTGHGSNAGDLCSEFCSKYYQVKLNNALVSQTNIWRNNCGFNNLYPQTGTWIYDRANWCPGDVVQSNFHPLAFTAGGNNLVDVDFQPYQHANAQSSYIVEGQVIYYGPYNYTTDAALENIISPNNHENFFRSNPACEEAKIMVRNTGSTAITSLSVEYGVEGYPLQTVTQSISIQPSESQEISLPGLAGFITLPTSSQTFIARVTGVNGATDNSTINNEMRSDFTPMPVWPNHLVVRLITNQGSFGGFNQSGWKLYDAAGNTVFSRTNNTNLTTYSDTLALPDGCYRLVVEDAGCDGLRWWANPAQGNGTLQVRERDNSNILPLKGYSGGDFGCGFTQAFRIQTPLGINEQANDLLVSVFPNPADDKITITFAGSLAGADPHKVELYDALGKLVYSGQTRLQEFSVNVRSFAAGIYILKYSNGKTVAQKKVVISH